MIKIKETPYTLDSLQKIYNTPWETFVALHGWVIISKYTEKKVSNELVKKKTLLELIKTLNIQDFKEYWDEQHLKQVMKDFVIWWTAKNEWWKKERWEMEKVFDIKARYYTFLQRAKKDLKPKKAAWRRMI